MGEAMYFKFDVQIDTEVFTVLYYVHNRLPRWELFRVPWPL